MSADVGNELRDALVETLNNVLSPHTHIRKAAEDQVRVLEVTEEFGVHLVEITLKRDGGLPIRQLSSVLLKQYVEAHWCSQSDKFRLPECSEMAKAKIREMLPQGLYEPISKVRSSVAYAISAIAHWDWPEQWPSLFDTLMMALKSGDEFAVHGAMRVLTEFSRDLTDIHIQHVAPVILPEMYRIFCEEQKYGIRTRGRAIEIFSTISNLICVMGEYDRGIIRTLLYPTLNSFLQVLIKGLQVPDGFTSDSGLKKEVLSALTMLLKNVPKQMGQYLGSILGPVWHTLTSSAETYINNTVNANESAYDPTDSDGDVLGFESLIFTIFDFVHVVVDTSKHKDMIKQGIGDLIYYLLLYMQITEEQNETWSTNPDAFVDDEDEDSYAFSVRISAQELLKVLSEELPTDCALGLLEALSKHLERANTLRAAAQSHWWKSREVVMLAMGVNRDLIVAQLAKGKISFDLGNFIQSVVLEDLDPMYHPFQCGRALWCGSRFAQVLTPEQLDRFLRATVSALTESPNGIIKISAVRAIYGFCEHLKACGQQAALQQYLPAILEGLVSMATQASPEVLSLILETLTIFVSVDHKFTSCNVSRISTLCLAVFIKSNNDPVIVALVQDVVKELLLNPACSETLQTKFVPTLTSILNAPSDKVPMALQAVALNMLEVMVRASRAPLGEPLINVAFPAVIQRTLNTDDLSTLQNGGECLRAFVSVSPEQVVMYRDSDGFSGLYFVIQVASHLLSPSHGESTAAFVGKLITVLLRKAATHLGDSLDLLLRAVLSKLQGAESLVVIQSLVLVYAHLAHTQLEAVIGFLGSVPGPSGQSALAFVLSEWCSKQHLFYGNYERKVTAIALAKLLEHGVTTQDIRLQDIIVRGDQVIDDTVRIRTRAQRRSLPEQWTQVPILVKFFKLIIYELSSAIDANMAKEDLEDSDPDDDDEEDWEEIEGAGSGMPEQNGELQVSPHLSMSSFLNIDGDTIDEEDDPDSVSDPINNINLQQYLTNFIMTFSNHPAYSMFTPHLNPHEKEVMQGIGLQC